MTATQTNETVTRNHDAVALAANINSLIAAGNTVTVNGYVVGSRHAYRAAAGRLASSWGTGSVSFPVLARTHGANDRTVWVKPGQTVTITVTPAGVSA